AIVSEGHDHGQKPTVGRQVILVKLIDVGVHRVNMLAESLTLDLEAAGSVERPNHQRAPALELTDDLDGDAIDGTVDSAYKLGPVAADRDCLTEHGCRGYHYLSCPLHIEFH